MVADSSWFKKTARKIVTAIGRKLDVNWFVRFLRIAQEEDEAQARAVTDAFKQIAWVNIAVEKRSSNIARPPWTLYSGENVIETGPIFNLFRDVNPFMSRYQLFEATNSWLDTRGEAFWLFNPDLVGVPTEIWVPNPGQMKAKLNEDRRITLWNYEIENEKIPFLPDQLIHFKMWNPWNAYRGVNPLVALDTELSEDFLSGISNLNMIRNGSIPDGLLSTEQRIDEAEAERVKKVWLDNHKGAQKAHTVSVMGQGVKYQQIQMTPADMEYFTMKKWSRETVLAKYGIPAVLAGITDSPATLSGDDTRDQMKGFWNLTLIPRLRFFEQKLETEFFNRYGLDMEGRFDLSEIAELQEDEVKKRNEERLDLIAGIGTINRVLERRGEEPVAWGDVAWLPLSLVPTSSGVSEPVVGESQELTATSIAFLKEERTPVAFLEKAKPTYTKLVKDLHWKAVTQSWEAIERVYKKDIQKWLFAQRSFLLEIISREKAIGADLFDEITDDAYWATQEAELREISKVWFRRAMEESEKHIRDLVETVGLPSIEVSWSIFDTRAVELLDVRLTELKGVTDTVKKGVKEIMQTALQDGLSESDTASVLRDRYNVFQNRAKTIARTEIGGVLNDSRIETYKHFGWTKHEWLSSLDERVRTPGEPSASQIYDHRIDGTIRDIGEAFPTNGAIRWPNDIDGDAGDKINCRCLTVPITED